MGYLSHLSTRADTPDCLGNPNYYDRDDPECRACPVREKCKEEIYSTSPTPLRSSTRANTTFPRNTILRPSSSTGQAASRRPIQNRTPPIIQEHETMSSRLVKQMIKGSLLGLGEEWVLFWRNYDIP